MSETKHSWWILLYDVEPGNDFHIRGVEVQSEVMPVQIGLETIPASNHRFELSIPADCGLAIFGSLKCTATNLHWAC